MCSMAYKCMVTAFMQIREEKMTMFTFRAHDKVTRIILAVTVSCQFNIQAEKESPNTFYNRSYIFSTNSEAQCPLLQICFYELASDLLIHL